MSPTDPQLELSFTETMRGFLTKGFAPSDDYYGAARAGREADTRAEFTLTMVSEDLDRFVAQRELVAQAWGRIRVDGFTAPEGSKVAGGYFKLFSEAGRLRALRMHYLLPFEGCDGKPYLLDGSKEVSSRVRLGVFGASTTLYAVIREGHDRSGAILATGIVTIGFGEVVRWLLSFRVSGRQGARQKAWALAQSLRTFVASLWDAVRSGEPENAAGRS